MKMIHVAGGMIPTSAETACQTDMQVTVVMPTIITDNKKNDFLDANESYMKKLIELALRNIDKDEEKFVSKE